MRFKFCKRTLHQNCNHLLVNCGLLSASQFHQESIKIQSLISQLVYLLEMLILLGVLAVLITRQVLGNISVRWDSK